MKIKTDFVTNSSSTAYVVLVPNAFYADDNELEKEYQQVIEEHEVLSDELIYKEIPECIELLKEGESLTYEYNNSIFYTVLGICENRGFLLASMTTSGENDTFIQGIKEEQIEKIYIGNIDLMSIFKLIRKGGKDVTSKIK